MKIIKFGAEWCAACKTLDPIIDELIPANPSHEFERVDVDDESNFELTQEYKIKSLPTTVILNHRGEELYRFVGAKKKMTIQAYIDDLS
jgi:thioredoxin-like negative regulator of GroEL